MFYLVFYNSFEISFLYFPIYFSEEFKFRFIFTISNFKQLLLILLSPFIYFTLATSKLVIDYNNSLKDINGLVLYLLKLFTILSFVILLFLLAFQNLIEQIIEINLNYITIIILSSTIFVSVALIPIVGSYQGLKKYFIFSTLSALSMYLRLIFLVAIIFLFFIELSLNKLLMVNLLAIFFAFIISFSICYFKNIRINGYNINKKEIIRKLKTFLPYIIYSYLFTFLGYIDLFLSRYNLNDTNAADYAGYLIIGKIVFFLNSTIALVFFPEVASNKSSKGNFFLKQSLIIYILISIFLFIFVYKFQDLITTITLGENFSIHKNLLTIIFFSNIIYSFTNLLGIYFLSQGKKLFMISLLILPIIFVIISTNIYVDIFTYSSLVLVLHIAIIFSFIIFLKNLLFKIWYSVSK